MQQKSQQDKVFDLIRPYGRAIAYLIFMLLLAAIGETVGLTAIVPVLSVVLAGAPGTQGMGKYFYPLVQAFPGIDPLYITLGAFLVIMFSKSLLTIYSRHIAAKLSWRMNENWANQILENYLRAPFAFLVSQKQGVLIHNVVTETYSAAKAVGLVIEFLAKAVLSFFLYTALLWTNWRATLVLTIIGGLAVLLMRKISAAKNKRAATEHLALQKDQSSVATESIATVRLIKTFSLERRMRDRFAEINARLRTIRLRHDLLNALPPPIGELLLVVGVCVGVIGLRWYAKGDLVRYLPIVGMLLLVSRQLLNSVTLLMSHWMRIQFFLPTLFNVHQAIHSAPKESHEEKGVEFSHLEQDIRLEDLTFRYDDGKAIFSGLNLVFPRGKMTALIGPSGIGKSTIADLLLGLVQPEKGAMLINGRPLSQYARESWRRGLGFVSQETIIFHASVRENITCWDSSISFEKVVEAAKAAQIHELIESLPQKYETILGERGMRISGGQRQRIAIARAIARDPEIFLFDEATSSLDPESERAVQASIDRLGGGNRTVIVITHRHSTIQNAHVVYDLGKLLSPVGARAEV